MKREKILPPLTFSEDEADALILGLRLVAQRDDEALARVAEDALARIVAMLPPPEGAGRSGRGDKGASPHLAIIEQAIRAETKLRIAYTDKKGAATERTIWPIETGSYEGVVVLAAWCEQRRDFRHFRIDRIASLEPLAMRFPTRRRVLLADWHIQMDCDGMH